MIRTPGSTYRLQLHKGFTFDDAAAVADYIKALGITHIYSSPYLQAAPGSMHGYDVVDHRQVNSELGGAEGHERFCKRLGDVGLGQILDIVPNHMSLGEENRYWWDVLENGTSSRYASFFDIDWNSPEERLRDKVLVPILGDQYGRVLEAGNIKLVRSGSTFLVEAAGQKLPVSPPSLPLVLTKAASYARNDTLSFLAASYGRLPAPDMTDRRTVLARHRDKVVLDALSARLCAEEDAVCSAIDRAVAELNANADALDELLNQQNYRLAYWKTADQQLGYRRFFDVNTLIGLRMEREYVFDETHALVVRWLKQGVLDGVRVDHPDGLRDPKQYFERLRDRAPEAWVAGEKILARGEFLRDEWPIQGTSGYDFLNMVSGLFIDPAGLQRLGTLYCEFTSDSSNFAGMAHDKKLNVEQEGLGSDVNRLTNLFVEICEGNRQQRDFTRAEVRRAIREVAACFSIYRTYVVPERNEITDEDRAFISKATDAAKHIRTDIDGVLFDFMRDVLNLTITGNKESEFVLRFQQFTSPVMAKGVEDTAFYCFNRLTSLNEVGGDPNINGVSVAEFHGYNERIQQTHPNTLLTLSTHDTKRSDDVRARLQVLSEVPEEFSEQVIAWSSQNAKYIQGEWPDKGTEWFLYQTLLGAWPISAERLKAYMLKATREAKQHTSWTTNNKDYEDGVCFFIDSIFSDSMFCSSVNAFLERIVHAGRINSLGQTLLKHTAPGIPDMYQGGEIWDLSLVDPDNRRPVDYGERRKLLNELSDLSPAVVMSRMDEGLPKLWTVYQALKLRHEQAACFGADARYEPLSAKGLYADRLVGYIRGNSVISVIPRLSLSVPEWKDTTLELPQGSWKNCLTGETISGGPVGISKLFSMFPVALLSNEK